MTVAGTAQGFVFVNELPGIDVQEVFLSTSPDAGLVGSDAGNIAPDGGVGPLPGFTVTGDAIDGHAVADDVGTGGGGGVGVTLVYGDGHVTFTYVNADGVTHVGPASIFTHGAAGGSVAITNFNGSFAVSAYDSTVNSTQIIASAICP
jgi:hypothetical protein